jgi:hypothetical protein
MTEPEDALLTLEDHLVPEVRGIEAPAADAVEQATPANPAEAGEGEAPRVPFETSEYDALEQSRIVHLDEEYR